LSEKCEKWGQVLFRAFFRIHNINHKQILTLKTTYYKLKCAKQDLTPFSFFDDVIKANPEQWLWMHRRWRAVETDEAMTQVVHGAP